VVFVEPGSPVVLHMGVIHDALIIDVRTFCLEVVQAAIASQAGVAGTEPYETNVKNFVTRNPAGIPPHIAGVPIIS